MFWVSSSCDEFNIFDELEYHIMWGRFRGDRLLRPEEAQSRLEPRWSLLLEVLFVKLELWTEAWNLAIC